MDAEQRDELTRKVEQEYGLVRLFNEIGLSSVTSNGKNVYAICPFHEGADNPTGFAWSNGFGYCFTHCHRSFTLPDVIMEVKKYTFMEALGFLADLVGYDIGNSHRKKKWNGEDNKAFLHQAKRASLFKFDITTEIFDKSILDSFIPRLHKKLRDEGFDNETREFYDLGFCTSGYLEDRITIPIDDYDGNIISVSGRSVLSDEEIDFGRLKKYLIYHDTDKAKTLYNISRALPYIDLTGEVKVVEGFKSVWRLHQWGIDDVVASMGNTLTDEQALILLKLNAKIIPCGDRDKAGMKLNQDVIEKTKKFAEVAWMDMYLREDIKEKSSPSDILQWQWDYLYTHLKEVM